MPPKTPKYQLKKQIIYELFNTTTKVKAYKNRAFNNCKTLNINSYQLQSYIHIKKPQECNYLIFDVDLINADNFNNIFYNNVNLLPNFYIIEYSKNKQCYTLQLFYLLKNSINIDDNFNIMYKKISAFFGADCHYKLKTGIHKNPLSEHYNFINQPIDNIQLFKNDYVAKLHSNKLNINMFYSAVSNLELFDLLPAIPTPATTTQKPAKSCKSTIKKENDTLNNLKTSNEDINIGFRNNFIFDKVRYYAYYTNDKSLNNILNYAIRENKKLVKPLADCEILATAKSIFNYVNNAEIKPALSKYTAKDRQKSIETRQQKAEHKIIDAIAILRTENKQITATAIKKLTNQKLETIKKYIEKQESQTNLQLPINRVIEKSEQKSENYNLQIIKENDIILYNQIISSQSKLQNTC